MNFASFSPHFWFSIQMHGQTVSLLEVRNLPLSGKADLTDLIAGLIYNHRKKKREEFFPKAVVLF